MKFLTDSKRCIVDATLSKTQVFNLVQKCSNDCHEVENQSHKQHLVTSVNKRKFLSHESVCGRQLLLKVLEASIPLYQIHLDKEK